MAIPSSNQGARACSEGVVTAPPVESPARVYTAEEIAEFLLNNSVNTEDYQENREEVRRLGLDPDTIKHLPPGVG